MVSSVTEEDIAELRAAGYLAKEIVHRLPAEGQIVPTPEPIERVVFIPHFFCGLGFPVHPFVRGLMYYYGVDFHDPEFLPQHVDVHRRVRGLPPYPSPFWAVAQSLQREADGGGWPTRRVRRGNGE